MSTLNLNVGVLGHVDSGKTSLCKCLSTVASTASFDKSPQSQERGITLDLGFSCFSKPAPPHLIQIDSALSSVRFTLVDCPGHASLIRTVIGGAQIIDLMILVIDSANGVQAQTGECIVLGELTSSEKLIVVLNKTDLTPSEASLDALEKKLRKILSQFRFKEVRIVRASAKLGKVSAVVDALLEASFIPDRKELDKLPFVLSVDHCFPIKGKGTILTGTVLSGTASCGSAVEIPQLSRNNQYTIKSLQVFRESVQRVRTGERIGLCINIKSNEIDFERGIVSQPGEIAPCNRLVLTTLKPIRFHKHTLKVGDSKLHVSIGHSTVLCKVLTMYRCASGEQCQFNHDHLLVEELKPDDEMVFALFELDKPVYLARHVRQLLIGSRLDENVQANEKTCRLGYYGHPVLLSTMPFVDCSQACDVVRVYKVKTKVGTVERSTNDPNVYIGRGLFASGKNADVSPFLNLQVTLSTKDTGRIVGSFGSGGKVKIQLDHSPSEQLLEQVTSTHKQGGQKAKIDFTLVIKKYVLKKEKTIFQ